MVSPDLRNQIRTYLDNRRNAEERRQNDERQLYERKAEFVRALTDFFNTPEVIELSQATRAKIPIFTYYQSSVGQGTTRGPPTLEISVILGNLTIERNGRPQNLWALPVDYKVWEEIVPYGQEFHDSSTGDYTFAPEGDKFLKEMGDSLMRIMEAEVKKA